MAEEQQKRNATERWGIEVTVIHSTQLYDHIYLTVFLYPCQIAATNETRLLHMHSEALAAQEQRLRRELNIATTALEKRLQV